ncbi:MAG TPA: hypothetical protein VHT27_00310 [Solirubrobacteraceae bacterium]|jgi:hypothetical protein|nr:hypothetical protein [Solirubrobacteraceae bacterium]
MSTRTIITSHPQVACDVCERTLLRGENADMFVAAGRRLTVCELCAPRAANEGWMRETESSPIALPPGRPRRGRSFLERLRQVARPPGEEGTAAPALEDTAPAAVRRVAEPASEGPVDDEAYGISLEPSLAEPTYVERAIAEFNASEFPRRIAGVARSLGAPEVSLRSAEHLSSVVLIVIAWELCWYRYEVDMSDVPATVRVLDQGTELSELHRDDRVVNATAEGGVLALAASA